jgi:hypothetical protein
MPARARSARAKVAGSNPVFLGSVGDAKRRSIALISSDRSRTPPLTAWSSSAGTTTNSITAASAYGFHSRNFQLQSLLVVGGGGGGGYSATVIRPATMIAAEAAINAAHRTRTRKAFSRTRGRTGQASNPENIANHPLVSGQGPRRNRSRQPPTPASNVQNHAAATARKRSGLTRELADMARGTGEALPPSLHSTGEPPYFSRCGSVRAVATLSPPFSSPVPARTLVRSGCGCQGGQTRRLRRATTAHVSAAAAPARGQVKSPRALSSDSLRARSRHSDPPGAPYSHMVQFSKGKAIRRLPGTD